MGYEKDSNYLANVIEVICCILLIRLNVEEVAIYGLPESENIAYRW